MRRNALAAIVITLALAAAACGGGDKPGSSGTDTAAADRAKAQKIVLTQSDMPAGWTGTQPTPDPEDNAQAKALAQCAGASDPSVATSAEVEGQSFSMDNAEVSSEVTFVKTTAQAQTDLAAITGPKIEGCVKMVTDELLTAELEGSGATLESFTFDRITRDKVGDATTAFRITATVAAGDQKATVYVDLIFILKGRAEISLSFTNVGTPFDEALEKSLIAKVGAKVAAA